jgi:hypothetical protein
LNNSLPLKQIATPISQLKRRWRSAQLSITWPDLTWPNPGLTWPDHKSRKKIRPEYIILIRKIHWLLLNQIHYLDERSVLSPGQSGHSAASRRQRKDPMKTSWRC